MKKIIIGLIIFGLFLPNVAALAKFPDDLPGPHLMPDSKLYFLKIWYEKIVIFFTFDVATKAEKYKIFAEKRAYEGQKMVEEGRTDLAQKVQVMYGEYLNKAKGYLERAIQKAMEKGQEALKAELDKKVEDIKNKIIESIHLW